MLKKQISFIIFLLFATINIAHASHYQGSTFTSASIDASNIFTGTLESTWAKNGGNTSVSINIYLASDTSRSTPLMSQSFTNTVTNNTDPAFTLHTANISFDLSALAVGTYAIRYQSNARVSGIDNTTVSSSFSNEAIVTRNSTANTAPIINSSSFSRIAIGQPFNQNINAIDPDGNNPLTYAFITNIASPDYGASLIPNLVLDTATGQLTITAVNTALFNNGDLYVAKVRVTDTTGAYSDRDVMFSFITTANVAPTITPLAGGNSQSVNVGQTLSFTVTAQDADSAQLALLSAFGVPANATFVPNAAGNPTTGIFTFTPDASQVGQTFGVNFDTVDDDATFPLSASINFQVTVTNVAQAVPTLNEWMVILLALLLFSVGLVRSRKQS